MQRDIIIDSTVNDGKLFFELSLRTVRLLAGSERAFALLPH
jgi:hypothetical protein